MASCFIAMFFLLFSCVVTAQEGSRQQKDSLWKALSETEGNEKLRTYGRLASLYFAESKDDLKMDTLLVLYAQMDEEAKKQDHLLQRGVTRANTLSAFLNRSMFDEVLARAPEYLDFLSAHGIWKYYYQVYNTMLLAWLYQGEFEKTIEEAQRLYEHAAERNSDEGKAAALHTMGRVYQSQKRFEEYETCCRQCIEILSKNESLIHLLAQSYYDLCQVLLTQERLDDVLDAAHEFEKVNERYDVYAGVPVSSTWINLWGIYTRLYLKTQEYEKAEVYCDKIDSVTDSDPARIMVCNARAQIFNHRKQYAEALKAIDKAIELIGETYTVQANSARGTKTLILSNMGRAAEAYELFELTTAVNDSIRNLEFANQIDKLRIQYEVDRHITEKERNRHNFLFALAGCLLLGGGLLVISILYRQKQQAYRKLVVRNQEWARTMCRKRVAWPSSEDGSDVELANRVCYLMEKEHLYHNPDLSLDLLAEQLGVHRNVLSKAINATQKKNFNQFVNEYRIQEAIGYLSDKNNSATMFDIALSCGFNSPQTFYRFFKMETGLSPALFRKNSQYPA